MSTIYIRGLNQKELDLISLEEAVPLQLRATFAIANNTLDLGPGQLESPGHIFE